MSQIVGGDAGTGDGSARNGGGAPASGSDPRDRVLTIPNALSVARLLGVPVFLWLVLGPQADAWAVALLIASAATDWLDGKIARALNQQAGLGEALDPAADRLYIAATLVGLAVRGIIPWWLVALLAAREVIVAAALGLLRLRVGFGTLQVSFAGKTATLCLFRTHSRCCSSGRTPGPGPRSPASSGGRSRSGARHCTGGRRSST